MRLLTLNLERYGPFTDRSVNFRPDAKLHVVYGPNEAGKSCALAAVTDLFFGIERQTQYDFLHDGKELRIGASIVGRDGSYLAFRRRKGNRSTLIDATDGPLSDDSLTPYLGSLTREVFCNAFGLNSEALRRGAEEMLKSDGDVGTSLFAAASGLRGLASLRQRLEEEAGTIFAPRASRDRKFYQALGRFEDARKAIHDRELRAGDWKTLNEKIEELSRRLDAIKTLRGLKAAEHARLSRNKRIAPLIKLIDRDRARLAALGPMPNVPIGFGQSLYEKLEAFRKATETRKRIADDEALFAREYAEITVDETLLARASDVLRLFGETGAYANNRRDLPRIQAETDEYQAILAEFAVRLGLHDVSAIDAAQPTDAAQALIRALISEGRTLADRLCRNSAAIAAERTSLIEIESQLALGGCAINPQLLRSKFAALTPQLRDVQKRADTGSTIRTETRSLQEVAGRLDPPVSDLDTLARTAVPGLETIARFRKDLDGIALEVRRENDRLAAATDAVAEVESRLRDLTSGRPVPSVEIIAAKREQRDTDWSALRATLFGSSASLLGGRLAEVVASFERNSSEADQLADSAASDAKRVAAYAAETHRLVEERRKEADARKRVAGLQNSQQELLKSWIAVWERTGICPLHPSEMASWRSALEGLLNRRERLEGLRDEFAAADAAVRDIEPAIRTLAVEVGLGETEMVDVIQLASQIEGRLQSISETWEKARNLDSRVSDARHRIEKSTATEAEVKLSLGGWSARWSLALSTIGMPPTTTLEEAEAALNIWNRVPGTIRERNNRARRVAGMHRIVEGFESDTKHLLIDIASDLEALPADTAVKVLNDRLIAARHAETRLNESQRRLTEIIRAREDADISVTQSDRELASLRAKLSADVDPSDFLGRLTERDNLVDALQDLETQLIAQADGYDEDKLRAELIDFNSDEVESALRMLAGEEQNLEREAQEVFAAHAHAIRERAEAEQGIGAEVAAQQRSSAEAELITASREWLVLKFGALLVGTAIERRRANEHDPLMNRAGTLFVMLTGGTFAGVGQDYDDHDVPRLVGRRPTGEAVPISGMSTGARDQLYLALRLAYLEEYAGRAETAPFVGDDLFASFDENRTTNGLAALAAIGDRVQPIVFTHHRHVAEIAETKFDADVLVL
jgi:uncharacterized protein YhaN